MTIPTEHALCTARRGEKRREEERMEGRRREGKRGVMKNGCTLLYLMSRSDHPYTPMAAAVAGRESLELLLSLLLSLSPFPPHCAA
eukprot:COSAG06_NODE_5157_length_3656_cov_14.975944_2_plen_86_part_00